MPTTKTTLILAGACLVLGSAAGVASHPTPDTKTEFIEVPGPTRVVEKEVRVSSPAVPTPLPESCLHAIDLLSAVTKESDIQTNATGEIQLALTDLGSGSFSQDIHAINRAIETLRKQKDRLGTSVIHYHEALSNFQGALEECNTDLGD
jgi:hypothetical protein